MTAYQKHINLLEWCKHGASMADKLGGLTVQSQISLGKWHHIPSFIKFQCNGVMKVILYNNYTNNTY